MLKSLFLVKGIKTVSLNMQLFGPSGRTGDTDGLTLSLGVVPGHN